MQCQRPHHVSAFCLLAEPRRAAQRVLMLPIPDVLLKVKQCPFALHLPTFKGCTPLYCVTVLVGQWGRGKELCCINACTRFKAQKSKKNPKQQPDRQEREQEDSASSATLLLPPSLKEWRRRSVSVGNQPSVWRFAVVAKWLCYQQW